MARVHKYAADNDYQDEAHAEGVNANGKYQHSLAGLKHLPTDGYYMYRTNPNPETDPWVITGAMKVNRILTRAEQADLVKKAGREPQKIQDGDIVTDEVVNSLNQKIADTPKFSLKSNVDNQGNPLNTDGSLKLDKIKSVDELADKDFTDATRNVQLPAIPKNVDDAIGANGKPVIIKKNIFEKNWNAHKFTPAESRKVLNNTLYNTDLVGRSQPTKKPNHWVAIKLDEKSPITVLEVNDNKDNVEVVGWYTLDERNLGRIKRQAERNGGELIMLSPNDKVESLSTPSLNSAAKIDNSPETDKGNAEKFSLKDAKEKLSVYGTLSEDVTDIADLPTDMAYRETDINELKDLLETGYMRSLPDGKVVEGADHKVNTRRGRSFQIGKGYGQSHGGKGFAKGAPWSIIGGTLSTGTATKVIIGVPGNIIDWQVGHHNNYSEPQSFDEIKHGKPLWVPFDEDGDVTDIGAEDVRAWVADAEGNYHEFIPSENDTPKFSLKTKPNSNLESASLAGEVDIHPMLDAIHTLYTKGKDFAAKLFNMKYFDVAKTPDFMKEVGLTGDKFTVRYGVMSRHFGKDGSHNFTEEEWQQLPGAIQNPFAISKLSDKKDGYRIYTTLKTEKGEYVVVGADVKNAGRNLEVNSIATIFGRRNDANLPKNENVIYKNKEITPEQMALLSQPNSDQYPSTQELSAAKIDNSPETDKGNAEKFSLKDEKTLVGVHNITEDKLRKALNQGGLANPSVAIVDSAKQIHEGYGGISLIMPNQMIAKRTGQNAGTFFGDAWTPSYPHVERQLGKNGDSAMREDIDKLPSGMQSLMQSAMQSYLDGRNEDGLAYMFLSETGRKPEMVKRESEYSDEEIAKVGELTNGTYDTEGLSEESKQALFDLYLQHKGKTRKEWDESVEPMKANLRETLKNNKEGSFAHNRAEMNLAQLEEYGYFPKNVNALVNGVRTAKAISGTADYYGTSDAAMKRVREDGLTKEYNNWLAEKDERYGIKEVIFDGYTPSGNRKYVPNDLKHVSQLMKKAGRNGAEGSGFSFNSFVAEALQSTGNLDKIRARKSQLTNNQADVDAFTDKWGDTYIHLASAVNPEGGDVFNDTGYARLKEMAGQRNPIAYAKKEYGVSLSEKDAKQFNDLLAAIREERPTMYFETKFERPVTFNEFSAAVVPSDMDADVRKGLEATGLRLYDYDANKEGDRQRAFVEAIHSGDNIRFSIKQFGTDIANASDRIKDIMNNEKIISRRIGSRAQAQGRVLETISRASDEFRGSNRASAKSGQDTWEKDRALGHVIQASYGTGPFLTEDEIAENTRYSGITKMARAHLMQKTLGTSMPHLNEVVVIKKETKLSILIRTVMAQNTLL